MDDDTKKTFHPFAVWVGALTLWGKNILPLVALSSISLWLARMVQLSRPLWLPEPATALNIALSTFFGLEVVAALVAHAFISLIIINHLKGPGMGRGVFPQAFDSAKQGLFYYIRSVVVLFLFLYLAAIVAAFLLSFGESVFRVPGGDRGIKLAILIGSGTFFVVAVLAIFWYGFFFSLAPLVAAYEKKGPLRAMAESRRRVKGNALRYLTALVLFAVGYIGLGILVYKSLSALGASRFIINMIDPVMLLVFGPLWLAVWYLSYERLSEIAQKGQAFPIPDKGRA